MSARGMAMAFELAVSLGRARQASFVSTAAALVAGGGSPVCPALSEGPFVNLDYRSLIAESAFTFATESFPRMCLPESPETSSYWLDQPLSSAELVQRILRLLPSAVLNNPAGMNGAASQYRSGCVPFLEAMLQRFMTARGNGSAGAGSAGAWEQEEWAGLRSLAGNPHNLSGSVSGPLSSVHLSLFEHPDQELAARIVSLQKNAQKHPLDPEVFDAGLVVFPKTEAGLMDFVRNGGRILAAHVGDTLAGYCVYDPRAVTVELEGKRLEKQANLVMIMNAPEYRGLGLHDMLLYGMTLDLGLRSEAEGVLGWVCLSNLPSFMAHIGKHPWKSLNAGKAIDVPSELASKFPDVSPEVASKAIFVAIQMDLRQRGRFEAHSRDGYREALELAYGDRDIVGVDLALLMATRWVQRVLRLQHLENAVPLGEEVSWRDEMERKYIHSWQSRAVAGFAAQTGATHLASFLRNGRVADLRSAMDLGIARITV